MYEFEILSQAMKIIVRGKADSFLKEQLFLEWILPSVKAVKDAAFLKYRASNWRYNTYRVVIL